jgi:hypothetical protein
VLEPALDDRELGVVLGIEMGLSAAARSRGIAAEARGRLCPRMGMCPCCLERGTASGVLRYQENDDASLLRLYTMMIQPRLRTNLCVFS